MSRSSRRSRHDRDDQDDRDPAIRGRPALVRAAGVAVMATALVACSGEGEGVSVAEVGRDEVVEVVEAPGAVAAVATATVSVPAGGTVARLDVAEGDRVTAGDVLLVVDSPQTEQALADAEEADAALAAGGLDTPTVDLSHEQAEARVAAEEGFAVARHEAEQIADPELRHQTLLSLDNAEAQYELSIAQADEVARQVEAGVAGLGEALDSLTAAQRVQTEAAVEAAQAAVDALTVRAPIGGTVSLTATGGDAAGLPAGTEDLLGDLGDLGLPPGVVGGGGGGASVEGPLREGQPVSSGQAVITVTDASELSVVLEVDETDVLLVGPGTAAEVVVDALPGDSLATTVASVDPAPVTSTRGGVSYTVRAPLPIPAVGDDGSARTAGRPLPGMSAIVRLTVRNVPEATVVPAAAVVRDPEAGVGSIGDAVWRVDDDGRATLTPVELGAIGDGLVEVVDGVEPGDGIVVTGVESVAEGQRVADPADER